MIPLTLDLTVERGSFALAVGATVAGGPLAIVGPNGAGKTTTLLALAGIVRPRRGRIAVGTRVLFDDRAGVDLPPEARGLAYLPQDYGLFPHLGARANVEFALRCLPQPPPADLRRQQARALLERVGALATEHRRPADLSGGERQRVALARALATAPRALLFDEPFAALDASARDDVRRYLAERLAELDLPAVLVTHDQADVEALGARVLVLENGAAVQQGTLAELRAAPATDYVARFSRKG